MDNIRINLLNAMVQGQGADIIVLHGLFGSANNWRRISSLLQKTYTVHALDLRNHGESFHSTEHHYMAMVEDVLAYMQGKSLDAVFLLGHSMGGKVAMQLALNYPQRVKKLLVADIAPKVYSQSGELQRVFNALNAVDTGKLANRNQADDILAQYNLSQPVRQFLLTNLIGRSGRYEWKINLPVLTRNFEHINAMISGPPCHIACLFLRGELSDYIQDEDKPNILNLFPNADIKTINNAGHWLHAEQPRAFIQALEDFLS